jgi:hypothetical protein
MADTNPLAAGIETLEGKLVNIATKGGMVVAAVGAVIVVIQEGLSKVADRAAAHDTVGLILAVGGLVASSIAAAAAVIGRSNVKAAMISANSLPMSTDSKPSV